MNKEDIEELKREIKALKQANIEYKDRIDKALEYIKYMDYIHVDPFDLERILRGEE